MRLPPHVRHTPHAPSFGRALPARAAGVVRSVGALRLGRALLSVCSRSLRPPGACGARCGGAGPPPGRCARPSPPLRGAPRARCGAPRFSPLGAAQAVPLRGSLRSGLRLPRRLRLAVPRLACPSAAPVALSGSCAGSGRLLRPPPGCSLRSRLLALAAGWGWVARWGWRAAFSGSLAPRADCKEACLPYLDK